MTSRPSLWICALAIAGGCSSTSLPFDGATTDAPSEEREGGACPGENPALRCRVSLQDCVPSSCSCSKDGWICTADCGGRLCQDAGADGPEGREARCRNTGGTLRTSLCCESTVDFPNNCSVGACGCAPANSHPVLVCDCPAGSCFLPERGCIMPVCTPGADQTCNDNPVISSLRGHCSADRTCDCDPGSSLNPDTGKCR